MLLDFGHLNYPENQDLTTQRSPKSCSVEIGGTLKASFQQIRAFRRTGKSTLLGGVNPLEILGETHTGIIIYIYNRWRDRGHIRPYHRGHIRPYPKTGHIRPYPTILPIDCVIQPFRVRPGDKGLLGGTGEHLGGTWGQTWGHGMLCWNGCYNVASRASWNWLPERVASLLTWMLQR